MEADDVGVIQVSEFDESIDNHLNAVASISSLCRLPQIHQFDDSAELNQVASSITFLRQWRDFAYEPRTVKFTPEIGYCADGIKLPQFSSAAVPKETQTSVSSTSSNDFILYCGGPIWGLDWCPQLRQDSGGSNVTCEFLAVAAHPPGSSYHKLGDPLIGRGVVQIWCLINACANETISELSMVKYKAKSLGGRPKKKQETHGVSDDTLPSRSTGKPKNESTDKPGDQKISKKRGRPRKNQASDLMTDTGVHNELIDYHPPKDATVGTKSTMKLRDRNNKNESKNDLCTADNDYCNRALVPHLMERYGQPVALGVVGEKSTTANSGKMMSSTLKQNHAISFTDADPEVSQSLKRVEGTTTQPIKVYVRRHKLAKTTLCKKTVITCPSNPEQSMACFDDATEYAVRDDLETIVSGTHDRPQKCVREKSTAISSAFHNEKEHRLASSVTEMSRDDAVNVRPCAQDTNYFTTANGDIGPPALCITTSGEKVESLSTDIVIPRGMVLPRLGLCLAHNGKVAWDVKWRPFAHVSHCKLSMGYLAVLLGNGSLEVWDVPLPNIVCDIFSSSHAEGTDPRFMKLRPVFKCSKLMFKGRQSIPLMVEWSPSFPNDLLLAGCHDGTVAVWKFSEGNPCEDTRPLLCFRADTTAIRAIAWAPTENGGEDAKVFITAGHTGLKFWDMRDPFYPLWTHPLLRIYSVDWMPKPRCIVICSDDGSLKFIGISEASNDLPVTGKPFSGSKLQGLHTFNCASYAIWNIHISRVTGMAAYCSADGTVVRFQVTTKAVEKPHSRNRVPQFLFQSLSGNETVLSVNTPPSNTPIQLNKVHAGPQSMRALLELCNKPQTSYLHPKESSVENQTLALWNGNDARLDQHMPTASSAPISMAGDENSQLAMVCQEVEANNKTVQEKTIKTPKPIDPPNKILAIHRVRWNMNKGSERWLCSGGAAGIVKCQEMVFTDIDKMYFKDK